MGNTSGGWTGRCAVTTPNDAPKMPPEAAAILLQYKAVEELAARMGLAHTLQNRNGGFSLTGATPRAVVATEPLVASAGAPLIWTPQQLVAHSFNVPPYFIEEIIAPGATTIIFGAREAGKTQLAFTMVRAIQEAALFLGRFQARRCRVAFCQFDMPPVAFQRRLQDAMQHCPFDADVLRIVLGDGSTRDTLAATRKTPWVARLAEWQPDVVVFDSLRKTHRESENDTGAPSRVYSKWHELFEGAAFVATHHVTKQPSKFEQRKRGSSTYRAVEETEAYRGTTAWLDDADFGVMLSNDKQRRVVQLTRGRTLSEETKAQLLPVRLDEAFGLFLVPTEPMPVERLKQYRLQHPTHTKQQAVEWIAAEVKGRHEATYYRWALDAGYAKGVVARSMRLLPI